MNALFKHIQEKMLMLSILFVFFLATYLTPVFFTEVAATYVREDGPVENLGALFFLLASVLLILTYFKENKSAKTKNLKLQALWLLGLGLFFFVACGEEISWGQRIFNFETPESIKDINKQQEFNLHNLEPFHGLDENGERKSGLAGWFTMHRIFYLALFGFIVVIPFIATLKNRLTQFINQVGFPIVPIWISFAFLFALLLAKVIQFAFAQSDFMIYHYIVEIMEANIAFVTAIIGWSFYRTTSETRVI